MYVLADLEWVDNSEGRITLTQIAMQRVDETWKTIDSIYRRIRPMDESFHQWRHIGFRGGSIDDFLRSPTKRQAFGDVASWLQEDDIICWWTSESKEWIQKLEPAIANKQIVLAELIENYLGGDGIGSPYHVGKHLFLERPKVKHYACHDVEMMRRVLEYIQFPQPIPESIPRIRPENDAVARTMPYIAQKDTKVIHKQGCPLIPTTGHLKGYYELANPAGKGYIPCECVKVEFVTARRQRNQAIIDRTEYCFIYAPDSAVFHKRDCEIMLDASEVKGTVLYSNCVATGRKPCRVCNPTVFDESYKHVVSKMKPW